MCSVQDWGSLGAESARASVGCSCRLGADTSLQGGGLSEEFREDAGHPSTPPAPEQQWEGATPSVSRTHRAQDLEQHLEPFITFASPTASCPRLAAPR